MSFEKSLTKFNERNEYTWVTFISKALMYLKGIGNFGMYTKGISNALKTCVRKNDKTEIRVTAVEAYR
jgi:hypothetical protein